MLSAWPATARLRTSIVAESMKPCVPGGQGNGGRGVEAAAAVPAEPSDTIQSPQHHNGFHKDPLMALCYRVLLR